MKQTNDGGWTPEGRKLWNWVKVIFFLGLFALAIYFTKSLWLPVVGGIFDRIPGTTQVTPDQNQPGQQPGVVSTQETQSSQTTTSGLPAYTVGFDAFPSYYTAILIKQMGLDHKYGFDLQLVTFCLPENCFTEDERSANLKDGTWDAIFTTLDKLPLDPTIGKITALIDESDGADKIVINPLVAANPQNPILNDLRGKRITYASGSVGEYFTYYLLNLMLIKPADVQLVPTDDVPGAVDAYINGWADVVSGWLPDIDDAETAGGKVIIDSHRLRVAVDVIITSNQAIEQKPELTQAFYYAWFEALKFEFENPDAAEQYIIDWGNPEWSYVAKAGDLTKGLRTLAQAGLGENAVAMGNPDIIAQRLEEAATVWQWSGKNVPAVDYLSLIAPQFVLKASENPSLMPSKSAINSTFLMTGTSDLPKLTEGEVAGSSVLAVLPLTKIEFLPDSTRLTDKAMTDILTQLLPILKASPNLYLKIEGCSAWPGPVGKYSQQTIENFAYQRAVSVAQFLSKPGYGIDPDRLVLGFIASKYPNSNNESEREQDRYVRFTLIEAPGK
jgi:hypothetical protein